MEAITFPDAEGVVIGYLNNLLAGRGDAARVANKVPSPRPARFVKVTRAGGGRRSLAQEDAQVTAQCWDVDSPEASELARLCRGLLAAMDINANGVVAHVPQGEEGEVGGVAFFPDPDTNLPRYQFTVIVRQRAQVI